MAKKKGKPVEKGSKVSWTLKNDPTTFEQNVEKGMTTKDLGKHLGSYNWGGKINSVKIEAPHNRANNSSRKPSL